MEIRQIEANEMPEALDLVWRTFLEYESPDYTEEGVQEFKKSIDDANWINGRTFYGAFEDNKIVGVIATKDFEHISLLFVDGNYHRRGIATSLFQQVCELNKSGTYAVNSSPYAKTVYEKFGFEYTDTEQSVNGLRFYPMVNNNISQYKNKQGYLK